MHLCPDPRQMGPEQLAGKELGIFPKFYFLEILRIEITGRGGATTAVQRMFPSDSLLFQCVEQRIVAVSG